MDKNIDLYCSRCYTQEGSFIRISTSKYGCTYYHCRKCNAERARKYRSTKEGMDNIKKAAKKSYRKLKNKAFARSYINYYIRVGKIKRPKICSKCREVRFTEAHHTDYSKPLDVIFMCRQCHADIHKLVTI